MRRSSPSGGRVTSVSASSPKSSEAVHSTRARAFAPTSISSPGAVMRTSGKASGSMVIAAAGPSATSRFPFRNRKR